LIVRDAVWETVPSVAVIVTVVALVTEVVATANVALILPPGTFTLDCTWAALWLLARLTRTPPSGAGPERVTIPVVDAPPPMVAGSRETEASVGGVTVRVAVPDALPIVAVIVTVVELDTPKVLISKLAVAEPDLTRTFGSTTAEALLLARFTKRPSAGAAPVKVTVPVAFMPPVTVSGLSDTESETDGLIMSVAASVELPRFALIWASVCCVTSVVATENVPVVWPAAIVTVAATEAAFELELKLMTDPPEGAAPLSVTVAVAEDPPVTFCGLKLTD